MSVSRPDPALLAKLVCPATRTPLRRVGDELISDAAGLAFPIRGGVPIMLVEEARTISAARSAPAPARGDCLRS